MDYAAPYTCAKLHFFASDMVLHVDSDVAYLVQPNAKSRIVGYYILSTYPPLLQQFLHRLQMYPFFLNVKLSYPLLHQPQKPKPAAYSTMVKPLYTYVIYLRHLGTSNPLLH